MLTNHSRNAATAIAHTLLHESLNTGERPVKTALERPYQRAANSFRYLYEASLVGSAGMAILTPLKGVAAFLFGAACVAKLTGGRFMAFHNELTLAIYDELYQKNPEKWLAINPAKKPRIAAAVATAAFIDSVLTINGETYFLGQHKSSLEKQNRLIAAKEKAIEGLARMIGQEAAQKVLNLEGDREDLSSLKTEVTVHEDRIATYEQRIERALKLAEPLGLRKTLVAARTQLAAKAERQRVIRTQIM